MKTHLVVSASLLALVLAPAAFGQSTGTRLAPYLAAMKAQAAGGFEGFTKGEKSISIAGTVSHVTGGTVGTVAGAVGYFFNPNVEGGVLGSVTWASGNGTVTTGTVGLFGRYHFNSTTKTVPYVGGEIEWNVGDGPKDTLFGGEVGADIFFQPMTAFFGEVFVLGTTGSGDTQYGVNFGLRIYMK